MGNLIIFGAIMADYGSCGYFATDFNNIKWNKYNDYSEKIT